MPPPRTAETPWARGKTPRGIAVKPRVGLPSNPAWGCRQTPCRVVVKPRAGFDLEPRGFDLAPRGFEASWGGFRVRVACGSKRMHGSFTPLATRGGTIGDCESRLPSPGRDLRLVPQATQLPRFPAPNGNAFAFPQTDFHLRRNENLHFTLYLEGHGDSPARKIGEPPTDMLSFTSVSSQTQCYRSHLSA